MPIIGSFGAGSGRGFGQTGFLGPAPIGLYAGGDNPSQINVINRIELSTAGNATDFGDLTQPVTSLSSGQVGNTTRAIVQAAGELTSPAAPYNNTIEYNTYATAGNSTDFGDLTVARNNTSGVSSSTRGVFAGGGVPGPTNETNVIDYITIASTGNAIDFGDTLDARNLRTGVSNSTRGVFAGGGVPGPANETNVIDYITIASTGNAIDFGDTLDARNLRTGVSNSTRGVFGGAFQSPGSFYNNIEYITIASAGNSIDFGDTLATVRGMGGGGSSTRGIFGGGQLGGSPYPSQNVIQYITIASTGNTTDFGDLTSLRSFLAGMSTKTTVVFAGGSTPGGVVNTMDFVTTATTGNATDFGDLTASARAGQATSSQHGGLQ